MNERRTAVIVGVGLIGGSMGLALRRAGWHVVGVERNPEWGADALEAGAIDEIGEPGECDLGVIATPVSAIAERWRRWGA